MFRNGYLYQEFTASKLITENVCPSLQEVRMFQVDPQSQSLLYDIDDDDQDEWDLLDDKTLQLTIKDDPQLQIQSGDRVKVVDGQFKNCKGYIQNINDGFVLLKTEEAKPFEIKVRTFQVRKSFKIGESVRIIQGSRAGQQGIIEALIKDADGEDSHAQLTMTDDSNHNSLTMMVSNLRIRNEIDPTTQDVNQDFYKLNVHQVNYQAGELVLFDNYRQLGLIIQTSADTVSVLTEHNQFQQVPLLEISRKVATNRQTVCVDSENNVLAKGTLVRIRGKQNPLRGHIGEIRQLFKQTLFIWIKTPLLSNSNGFYSVHCSSVINAGAQHLKEVNQLAGLAPADGVFDVQANPDRQQRDNTLRSSLVLIKSGAMKGLKGTVLHANETEACVHVHCKGARVMVERQNIEAVYGNRGGMYIQQNADLPMQLSFDEAANREYVNTLAEDGQNAAGGRQGMRLSLDPYQRDDDLGDKTPARSLDDELQD